MASWDDVMLPSEIDPDAFLYCGADPCWGPSKEEKLADAEDKPAGQCRLCGGDGLPLFDPAGTPILDASGLPVVVRAIDRGSHRVCARCMRDGKDQHSQAARSGRATPPPKADPGYVARDGVQVPERFARMLEG